MRSYGRKQIKIPRRMDESGAAAFLGACTQSLNAEVITVDFGELEFVLPGGALTLAIGIKDLVEHRKARNLRTNVIGLQRPTHAVSYLAFIGFFGLINVDFGRKINSPPGSDSYLPIHRISRDDLSSRGGILQETIDRYAKDLARVIYPEDADITKVDMLSYCMREVIRNVFEHSRCDECYVAGQRWANGYAEIAIVDRGVGLTESLSEAHEVESSRHAISMAIQPGMTRIVAPENNDIWQNSGFGLYVLSEVGRDYGSFSIASNGEMLNLDKSGRTWTNIPMAGTFVKLYVSTENSDYFSNILTGVVSRGEEIAKEIQGARQSASSGSKKVSFDNW